MRESAIETPNKVLEVQHVIEDGALVAVHSKLEMQMNNKLTILAVVHICRFENEKLRSFGILGKYSLIHLLMKMVCFSEKPETIRAFLFYR